MRVLLTIALPLYLADQLTKWLVLRGIGVDETITLINGLFYLVQVHNTGAAFGMLRNNNSFFIVLSSVALIVVGVLWWRGTFRDWWTRVGLALLVAGIFGNLTDRLVHGHVVDFLHVILPIYGPWPAFNVADSCICVAAGIFVVRSLFERRGGASG
jgi:signal peptidase II